MDYCFEFLSLPQPGWIDKELKNKPHEPKYKKAQWYFFTERISDQIVRIAQTKNAHQKNNERDKKCMNIKNLPRDEREGV